MALFRVFYCKNSHQAIIRWSDDGWQTYDQDKAKNLSIEVPTYAELIEEKGRLMMYISGEAQSIKHEVGKRTVVR